MGGYADPVNEDDNRPATAAEADAQNRIGRQNRQEKGLSGYGGRSEYELAEIDYREQQRQEVIQTRREKEQASQKEQQASGDSGIDYAASSRENVRNRPGYTDPDTLGDSRTRMIARLLGFDSENIPEAAQGVILEEQRQKAYDTPTLEDDFFYGTQLEKWKQNKVELSSEYHHETLASGLQQKANPYEYAGDLALEALKGSPHKSSEYTSPSSGTMAGVLPGGRGLQEVMWDSAVARDRNEPQPERVSFMDSVRVLNAAEGLYGSYGSLYGGKVDNRSAFDVLGAQKNAEAPIVYNEANAQAPFLAVGVTHEEVMVPSEFDLMAMQANIPIVSGAAVATSDFLFGGNKKIIIDTGRPARTSINTPVDSFGGSIAPSFDESNAKRPFVSAEISRERIEPTGELPFVGVVPVISPALAGVERGLQDAGITDKQMLVKRTSWSPAEDQFNVVDRDPDTGAFGAAYTRALINDKGQKSLEATYTGPEVFTEPVPVGAPRVTTKYNELTGETETFTEQDYQRSSSREETAFKLSPIMVGKTTGEIATEKGAVTRFEDIIISNTPSSERGEQAARVASLTNPFMAAPVVASVLTERFNPSAAEGSRTIESLIGIRGQYTEFHERPLAMGTSYAIAAGFGAVTRGAGRVIPAITRLSPTAGKVVIGAGKWGGRVLKVGYGADVASRSTEGFTDFDPTRVAGKAIVTTKHEIVPMTVGFGHGYALPDTARAGYQGAKNAVGNFRSRLLKFQDAYVTEGMPSSPADVPTSTPASTPSGTYEPSYSTKMKIIEIENAGRNYGKPASKTLNFADMQDIYVKSRGNTIMSNTMPETIPGGYSSGKINYLNMREGTTNLKLRRDLVEIDAGARNYGYNQGKWGDLTKRSPTSGSYLSKVNEMLATAKTPRLYDGPHMIPRAAFEGIQTSRGAIRLVPETKDPFLRQGMTGESTAADKWLEAKWASEGRTYKTHGTRYGEIQVEFEVSRQRSARQLSPDKIATQNRRAITSAEMSATRGTVPESAIETVGDPFKWELQVSASKEVYTPPYGRPYGERSIAAGQTVHRTTEPTVQSTSRSRNVFKPITKTAIFEPHITTRPMAERETERGTYATPSRERMRSPLIIHPTTTKSPTKTKERLIFGSPTINPTIEKTSNPTVRRTPERTKIDDPWTEITPPTKTKLPPGLWLPGAGGSSGGGYSPEPRITTWVFSNPVGAERLIADRGKKLKPMKGMGIKKFKPMPKF